MKFLRGLLASDSRSIAARTSPAEDTAQFHEQKQNRVQGKCGREQRASLRYTLSNIVLVIFCCLLFGVASFAHGQSTFGSIRGTVQDATGAAIPGTQVVLHSTDENTDR